jgi:hypothetical protein
MVLLQVSFTGRVPRVILCLFNLVGTFARVKARRVTLLDDKINKNSAVAFRRTYRGARRPASAGRPLVPKVLSPVLLRPMTSMSLYR